MCFALYIFAVSNFLQSASVTASVKKIAASCTVADSEPRALCIAVVFSNNTNNRVFTFQSGPEYITLDCVPGQYNINISIHTQIDGNSLVLILNSNTVSSSSSLLLLSSFMSPSLSSSSMSLPLSSLASLLSSSSSSSSSATSSSSPSSSSSLPQLSSSLSMSFLPVTPSIATSMCKLCYSYIVNCYMFNSM